MLGGAGVDDLPVGGDHLGGQQVVDRQPVAAAEVPDAASQGETADARRGDDAAGGGQPVGVGGVVEVTPGGSAAGPSGARRRIHMDVSQQGEVDHHAVVVGAEPRRAVAATAYRQVQAGLAGEVHRRHHIGDLLGSDDDLRTLVEHAVVDRPSLVIAGIIRR